MRILSVNYNFTIIRGENKIFLSYPVILKIRSGVRVGCLYITATRPARFSATPAPPAHQNPAPAAPAPRAAPGSLKAARAAQRLANCFLYDLLSLPLTLCRICPKTPLVNFAQ